MKTLSLFGLTATTLLILALPTVAKQHDQHHGQQNPPAAAEVAPKSGMAGEMSEHCAMMMQMHQKMESDTRAQDAKLKELTTTMDLASGDTKVTAMSAVIKELVAQRTARQEMSEQMHLKMMEHMKEHMQQGGTASMMKCPMMTPAGNSKGGMQHDMRQHDNRTPPGKVMVQPASQDYLTLVGKHYMWKSQVETMHPELTRTVKPLSNQAGNDYLVMVGKTPVFASTLRRVKGPNSTRSAPHNVGCRDYLVQSGKHVVWASEIGARCPVGPHKGEQKPLCCVVALETGKNLKPCCRDMQGK